MKIVPLNRNGSLNRGAGDVFKDVLDDFDVLSPALKKFVPLVDVAETEDAYLISLELPGMNEEDVSLTLEDQMIVISGEKKVPAEDDHWKQRHAERRYGQFKRQIRIPGNYDPNSITARLTQGVLSVRIEKSEDSRPRKIQITTS